MSFCDAMSASVCGSSMVPKGLSAVARLVSEGAVLRVGLVDGTEVAGLVDLFDALAGVVREVDGGGN